MAQLHFRVSPLFLVPPEAFQPRPKVESAIVKLTPHTSPPASIDDPRHFARLVKQAFSQRRKTIRNVLRDMATAEQLAAADIDGGQRPEQLSLQQFARLSNLLVTDQ